MYLVFTARPYTHPLPRAVLKPSKVYFFDNADILGDETARFENLVATSLFKRLHFLEDRDGYRYELRYYAERLKPAKRLKSLQKLKGLTTAAK